MIRILLQSLRAVVVLTVLTGVLYPFAVLVAARVLFKQAALGSRVYDRTGKLVGSSLIGQAFSKPEYLWGRPSAAGNGYDATSSGGSNVSPVGSDAITKIQAEEARLKAANPDAQGEPPLLLTTASASGLDPHISPEAALWQVPRIAKARGVTDPSRIARLVKDQLEDSGGRSFFVLGEPRINVLEFNIQLDQLFPLSR
jgi:K+-transporting ATPase ATPase C chain